MKRKDAQLIADIKEYLDDNLYQDHPIAELCRRFTINREKLQAGFQELTQTTVHSYIIHQRIQQAALRLVETEDSIKAIAMDSGYKKQRSFNKTFKSIFHLTPAAYRKSHQRDLNL